MFREDSSSGLVNTIDMGLINSTAYFQSILYVVPYSQDLPLI